MTTAAEAVTRSTATLRCAVDRAVNATTPREQAEILADAAVAVVKLLEPFIETLGDIEDGYDPGYDIPDD